MGCDVALFGGRVPAYLHKLTAPPQTRLPTGDGTTKSLTLSIVSRMASEKPKRDIADFFRPYAKPSLPKSIPAKRPSPTPSDELDGGTLFAERQLRKSEPRTPVKSTRVKNAVLSPYKSPFGPRSGASLTIPIRSPKPSPYSNGTNELTQSSPVSRKGGLFASASPKKDQEEKALSFADIPTSGQTIVRDGKVIAVKSSDDEDEDSLCSLDDLLGRYRRDTATESSSPPDLEENDLEVQRARSLSVFTNGRSNALIGRDKLRELTSKANGLNFDISLLVGDHFDDEEIEANVIKAREGYKVSNDQERLKRQNVIDKNLLSSMVGQNEGGRNLERLLNAVERTEALALEHTWSMFHSKPPAANSSSTHSFPLDAVESEPWRNRLRDQNSRSRAYLSGYLAEKAAEGAIPDEVVTWTFHSIFEETRDDLRKSYLRVVKAASPRWTSTNLTSSLIEETFCRSGADSTKVTCANDIDPGPQVPTDHGGTRKTRLLSTIEVLLKVSTDMASEALSKFVKLLMRLAIDTHLMSDSHLCAAVEDAVSRILGHIEEGVSVPVANCILEDIGLCVKDPFLQMQVLKHILPTSSAAASVRIQLANLFLQSAKKEDATVADALSPDINLPQLTAHLHDPRYDVSHPCRQVTGFDYSTLSSLVYIFDTALANGGRPPNFPDDSSERDFNHKVDILAERVKSIITSIADTGASHMRRTEAKETLNALQVRLLYAVRTRPRPKKSVFGGRDGAEYRAEGKSAGMMQQFLARREGQKALREREARSTGGPDTRDFVAGFGVEGIEQEAASA